MKQAASALVQECVSAGAELSRSASVLVQERSSFGLPRCLSGKESLPVLETQVRSLGREAPLEEGRPTHSSAPARRLPWTEEPGGPSPWGGAESDTTEHRAVAEFF